MPGIVQNYLDSSRLFPGLIHLLGQGPDFLEKDLPARLLQKMAVSRKNSSHFLEHPADRSGIVHGIAKGDSVLTPVVRPHQKGEPPGIELLRLFADCRRRMEQKAQKKYEEE
jgi:hypothetical protein